jgi:hypothetical protein
MRAGIALCALILSAIGCSKGSSKLAEKLASATQDVVTAGTAPDSTGRGPYGVGTGEYRLAASRDNFIYDDRFTEIWARAWWPQSSDLGKLPLVVFLHGNHATCGTFFCHVSSCGFELELPDGPRIDDRIDYTFLGTCPLKGQGSPPAESDYVVTPNHEGYGYLAEQLASRGYLVVSINANRGITAGPAQDRGTPGHPFIEDRGLNLGRGRLVLEHLSFLSRWNRGVEPTPGSLGFDLRNRIDFSQVGLVGHSRGGEGVRAAYNTYTGRNTDIGPYAAINWKTRIGDPVDFKGIFEIAPVDRQTVRTLNAEGINWAVMLPGCDGDVINQQGMWPYDRMIRSFSESPARQKSFYYVLGANHNYWNTEWQFSDSSSCIDPSVQLFETDPASGVLPGVTGSAAQRTTGSASITALIRGSLRAAGDPADDFSRFLTNFDPQFDLPRVVTDAARIERGFISSPSGTETLRLEDFVAGDPGFGSQTSGGVTVAQGGIVEHGIPFLFREPDDTIPAPRHRTPLPAFLPAAKVSWQRAGDDVFFQINLAGAGQGVDLSAYATLDFRVDRESPRRTTLNPTESTNFHIQLVDADGTVSQPVAVSDVIDLVGPFGTDDADLRPPATLPDGYHINMPTARIPIGAFGSANIGRTQAIRLTFDDTPAGMIYVTNFRASRKGLRALPGLSAPVAASSNGSVGAQIFTEGNVIEEVRLVRAEGAGAASDNSVLQFTVSTQRPVMVGDELLQMAVGSVECDGWYADNSLHRITFACPAALEEGAPIRVGNNARMAWSFGNFSSNMIR